MSKSGRSSELPILNSFAASQPNLQQFLNKLPYKQKSLLMETISAFRTQNPTNSVSPQPNINKSPLPHVTSHKAAFKKLKALQSKNLKQIQKQQLKYQNELSRKFSEKLKEHEKKFQEIIEKNKGDSKEKGKNHMKKHEEAIGKKEFYDKRVEKEIDEKLQKIERKIRRSEVVHDEFLKEKVDKTVKLREMSKSAMRIYEETNRNSFFDRLRKCVDKDKVIKSARERSDKRFRQISLKNQKKSEKREQEKTERSVKLDRERTKSSQKTEKNLITTQQIFNDRKERLSLEAELKKEQKRLKSEEEAAKVQKAKLKFNKRMDKVLEKYIEKHKKVEEIKRTREDDINLYRDSAIRTMIEKEKLREAVAAICRSPRSKSAQKIIKNFYHNEDN